jgi:hypothetical protein
MSMERQETAPQSAPEPLKITDPQMIPDDIKTLLSDPNSEVPFMYQNVLYTKKPRRPHLIAAQI